MRSIDQILREAWEEVRRDHNVGLTDVHFDPHYWRSMSNIELAKLEVRVEGVTLTGHTTKGEEL